jgi:hypothetical protein
VWVYAVGASDARAYYDGSVSDAGKRERCGCPCTAADKGSVSLVTPALMAIINPTSNGRSAVAYCSTGHHRSSAPVVADGWLVDDILWDTTGLLEPASGGYQQCEADDSSFICSGADSTASASLTPTPTPTPTPTASTAPAPLAPSPSAVAPLPVPIAASPSSKPSTNISIITDTKVQLSPVPVANPTDGDESLDGSSAFVGTGVSGGDGSPQPAPDASTETAASSSGGVSHRAWYAAGGALGSAALVALGVAVHRMRRSDRVAGIGAVAVQARTVDADAAPVTASDFMYDGGVIVIPVGDGDEEL